MAGKPVSEERPARTLLEQLLWAQDHTYVEMTIRFEQVAAGLGERATISPRHLRRLASGERRGTTPVTRRVVQAMFGRSIEVLLAAPDDNDPDGAGRVVTATAGPGSAGTVQKEMLAMAAQRARRFTLATASTTLTGEAVDQLQDDVASLALRYQQEPLPEFLGDLTQTQDTLFTLLEGRQPPSAARHLLLLAAVTSGLLAKVSHDLADPHAALTQSRTAYLCADQADHDGLRAWTRGLQSLIAYWAGRHHDAIRYAHHGATHAPRSTAAVWLHANEARAWGALGNTPRALAAIHAAEQARDAVQPDELDDLGGFCTFSPTRQLYYTADALTWLPSQADAAQRYSHDAVTAYTDTTDPAWAFGDSAGSACNLATARITGGHPSGAAQALEPVLDLPSDQRINGIIQAVNRVHHALTQAPPSREAQQLQEQIEMFTATPIAALRR